MDPLLDLDFADDLVLVSHTHQHVQEKTTRLSIFSQLEEDRSDDVECLKTLASQSERSRRKSFQ